MDSPKKLKSEKIHLTLTLGEIDALVGAGQFAVWQITEPAKSDLTSALQKLDEATNV